MTRVCAFVLYRHLCSFLIGYGNIAQPYKNKQMKKVFYLMLQLATVFAFSACSGGSENSDNANSTTDSIANNAVLDSIDITLSRLDSIQSKGQLVHFDTWKIGNLKSIEVQAQKFSCENDSIVFITLRKDCGGEYYYSWEDAFIFQKELPSLYHAVKIIKSNLSRNTDHNEKYAYATKDNVVVFAENTGKGWTLRLSVDVKKSNSTITLTSSELDKFIELMQQASQKIDKIK